MSLPRVFSVTLHLCPGSINNTGHFSDQVSAGFISASSLFQGAYASLHSCWAPSILTLSTFPPSSIL
ncbi:hypothetical protein TorRG33x02_249910 [Trema orientale]|uniref:Uncharacterized protein n=1 Tax=Trema orientale TaxID=63057 RepID=A0A2P5DJ28_TREOI|nr:hypothetical protein TorRG33x02_249910 [Trema orientale]